jgi:small subunit ribosomal protein S21
MTKVKVRKGESLEQALRRFNREVHRARILQEAKDRERYVKPSEVKRQSKKRLARKIYYEKGGSGVK